MSHQLCVVGIGDDGAEGLAPAVLERIQAAQVLVGSQRQLAFFSDYTCEKMLLQIPLSRMVARLRKRYQNERVVILASGDPLLHGIGAYLIQQLGDGEVEIHPHVSAVQLAFARAGLAWHDARIVSVHGRELSGLAQIVNRHENIALFTDGDSTPGVIAEYLLRFSIKEYDAFVGEHLGGEQERTGWYELQELVDKKFSALNVVILRRKRGAVVNNWPLGIEDHEFFQRQPKRGLITKREVRVLCLAELKLQPDDVLWDIGACTGSISIEATLRTPGLRAFAIEKNEEDVQHLYANRIKFRTDFVVVHDRAPARLDEFPDPDAVFIGGSGGELEELLQVSAARLRPGGRIVVNAIALETLSMAHQTLQRLGFAVTVHLLQAARSQPIINLTRLEGMNPVYLISARRGEGHE